MTTFGVMFKGGFAHGTFLHLSSAPEYLRVTRDRFTREVDALNCKSDRPRASEEIAVYVRVDVGHIFARVKGRCECWIYADYAESSVHPPDDVARSKKRWHEWVEARRRWRGVKGGAA